MTKTTSIRHLQSFEERHNCKISKEDLIDILNVMQLYLKFEELGEMEETEDSETSTTKKNQITDTENNTDTSNNATSEDKKTTKTRRGRKKSITATINTSSKQNTKLNDEIIQTIRKMQFELGRIPSIEELKNANIDVNQISKAYGGWRNLKKKLKDTSEEDSIYDLMQKLNKIPTREDIKENNISIDNLLLQYGSWREIKKNLNLDEKYEDIVKKQLQELKNTENLTMDNCKSHNIDISFLIRKYGGWKNVLHELKLA